MLIYIIIMDYTMSQINNQLNSDKIREILSQKTQKIHDFGVLSLSLFGSTVKGTATLNSDLDFLVEFEGMATFDRYMDLKFFLEDLFNKPVDLVTKKSLKSEISQAILQEAVNVA